MRLLPNNFVEILHQHGKFLPDSVYLKILYRYGFGKTLNLRHPKTLNEKTHWLKLYDRRSIYPTMVDKFSAKDFVRINVGEKYVVPLLGVWNRFEDIDFAALPEQFVLKTTHDSGGVVICTDKANFDIPAAREKLKKSLANNYYWIYREWAYKHIRPRIMAEELLVSPNGTEIKDYKVFTFNGKVKLSFVATNRHGEGGVLMNFYDRDWNSIPVERLHPRNPLETPKPEGYDTMVRIAETIGKDMFLLRTDFYQIGTQVFVGELTIYPSGGFDWFKPEGYDELFGSWLKLPCD